MRQLQVPLRMAGSELVDCRAQRCQNVCVECVARGHWQHEEAGAARAAAQRRADQTKSYAEKPKNEATRQVARTEVTQYRYAPTAPLDPRPPAPDP